MTAHCFGKLPLAGDFLRHRLDAPGPRALAGWMEKGHALVEAVRRSSGRASGGQKPSARRFRFVVDLEGDTHALAGILHESHDKLGSGGSRRFPFAYFVDVAAAPLRTAVGSALWNLAALWDQMEARLQGSVEAKDARSFFEQVDAPGIAMEPEQGEGEIQQRLRGTRAGEFWSQVRSDATGELRIAFFEYLVRVLKPHAGRKARESAVALRLPVAGTAEQVKLQCAFWAELVVGILGSGDQLPHFFLEAPEATGPGRALQIHYKALDDNGFASLMTERYATDYIDDLTGAVPPRRGNALLSEPARAILGDDGQSLAALSRHAWI